MNQTRRSLRLHEFDERQLKQLHEPLEYDSRTASGGAGFPVASWCRPTQQTTQTLSAKVVDANSANPAEVSWQRSHLSSDLPLEVPVLGSDV